jgi:thiol-disulfide isomerase/thioredoxin
MAAMMRKWFSMALLIALACGRSEQPAAPKVTRAPRFRKAVKPKPPEAGDTGSMMPAYRAPSLNGGEFAVTAEKGNVILLNLWATWCGPCRFEIPELEKLHIENAARRFKVVGVSLDDTGAEGVKEFVAAHKMTYPIVIDAEGKIASIFQTSIIPTTVLIDRSGKIVWKQYGAISAGDASLKKALENALK